MTVRKGTSGDVEFVAACIRAAAQENPFFRNLPLTVADLRRHGRLLLDHPGVILNIAEDASGKPVGLVVAQLSEFIGTTVPFVADVLLYVRPENRSEGHAKDLIAQLDDDARQRGLYCVLFPVVDSATAEAVSGLTAKFGYSEAGTVYRKMV